MNAKKAVLAAAAVMAAMGAAAAAEGGACGKALLRAKEQWKWFKPEAARMAVEDLRTNPKYDHKKHSAAVEALIAAADKMPGWLESKDAGEQAKAVALMKGYRDAMLANPLLDGDKLLCTRYKFAGARARFGGAGHQLGFFGLNAHSHMWLDTSNRSCDPEIGYLSKLRSEEPEFTTIYRPENGTVVRDVKLDWDASRMMFTGVGEPGQLRVYEIPATLRNGSEKDRREVSPPQHADVNWWGGVYLPNPDQVVMLGTGTYSFLPCEGGNIPMAVLYRVDRKTGKTIQLTYEQDSDYTPSVTHDGRVMFTRWEYSDVPHYFSRILMTMNPDGVGQLALWGGGSYFPTFFYDAKCVPGEKSLVSMFASGHHSHAEVGRMLLIDPSLARNYPFEYDPPDRWWARAGVKKVPFRIAAKVLPKERTGVVHEFPGYGKDVQGDVSDGQADFQFERGKPYFTHPEPLAKNYYLATCKRAHGELMGIYLVDRFDNITLIAETEEGAYLEPQLFAAKKRPPVIPDRSRIDPKEKNCTVHIADIYDGPGLKNVPRGKVKRLRIFSYHFCFNGTGGHFSCSLDNAQSSWDIKRIIGEVDVEEDGSCIFEMPANTPISLQPLDEQGQALQIMRSWVVGMPGERVSCVGCHEDNRSSVLTMRTMADKKGKVHKPKTRDGDPVHPFGFEADVWPVLQKYCLDCHGTWEKAPVRGPDQGGYAEEDSSEHPGIKRNAYVIAARKNQDGGLQRSFVNKAVRPLLTGAQFAEAEKAGTLLRLSMLNSTNAYRMVHPYVRRPGAEFDIQINNPMEWHASTSPLIQMLRKGHYGVKVSDEDMRTLYAWIDLNAPWRSRWGGDGEDGVHWQTNRRKELSEEFAGVGDDPEREDVARMKLLAERGAPARVAPGKCAARGDVPKVANWPMSPQDAHWLQTGKVGEPTMRVVDLGNGTSLVMRKIPAGEFAMGSVRGYADEAPMAKVRIGKPFWMCEAEVSNAEYAAFDPKHDTRYHSLYAKDHVTPGHIANHRRQPVARVSWNEAMAFCAWLSKKTGEKVTLPTEAQWEWAARAGAATDFPWGDWDRMGKKDADFSAWANLADRQVRFQMPDWAFGLHPYAPAMNYPLHDERWVDDWYTVNYVRQCMPNEWGLYDMIGNASEWTRSDYKAYPYVADGSRETLSQGEKKVARGGSFASRPREATLSYRLAYEPWQKVFDVGFRCIIEEK